MKKFTVTEAIEIVEKLGVDFSSAGFTPEEFLEGLQVELEHGLVDAHTNVSNDDSLTTGKIVLAHLNETPRYYDPNIGLEHVLEEFKGDSEGKKIQIV